MNIAHFIRRFLSGVLLFLIVASLGAQVPAMINYQGRIVVDGVNFSGNGQFKFAFVDSSGTTTFWSHDGTSTSGGAPQRHIVVPVTAGLYSVTLGDPAIVNSAGGAMRTITPNDLGNTDLWLRIWFNDGQSGFQQLAPDQRITAVAYALVAESVSDGAITTAKLAPGSVTADKLAQNVVGNLRASLSAADPALLALGYLKVNTIPAPLWQIPGGLEGPSGRSKHGAVWTGSGMLVWGGKVGSALSNQGGIYFPDTGEWSAVPTNDVSPPRSGHSLVWTGDRMIAWGGYTSEGETQTGAFYVPSSLTGNPPVGGWSPTSLTSAPVARSAHSAVWTGSRMLVWGGKNSGGVLRSGGRYTPPTGSVVPGSEGAWLGITASSAPVASHGHSAVWTGSRMITWGGLSSSFQPLAVGGIYDPGSNSWIQLPSTGAPAPRTGHSAVWTGSQMIIFGGTTTEIPGAAGDLLADGAAYDPVSATWSALSALGAPSARHHHQAIWTGNEVLIFGGEGLNGESISTAAAYNPLTDTWRALPSTPETSAGQTVVWSGTRVFIFGQSGLLELDPTPAVYLYAKF